MVSLVNSRKWVLVNEKRKEINIEEISFFYISVLKYDNSYSDDSFESCLKMKTSLNLASVFVFFSSLIPFEHVLAKYELLRYLKWNYWS